MCVGLFSLYINLSNHNIVDFHLLAGLHKCLFAIFENKDPYSRAYTISWALVQLSGKSEDHGT